MKMDTKLKKLISSIGCVALCIAAAKLVGSVVSAYGTNMYATNCVGELILAVFAIVALIILKRTEVLKFKAEGFKEGILTGGIILGFGAISFIAYYFEKMTVTASKLEIAFFVIDMLLVGIAEEVIFRGIIQNSVMEYIGTDSVGKVRAGIVISGVIFASVHLFNTFAPDVTFMDALRQTISVIPLGAFFGTIYYRGKNNLWPGILLHAFNDFYTLLLVGYISNATLGKAISDASSNIVGTLIVFTLIDMWIMRKRKLEV